MCIRRPMSSQARLSMVLVAISVESGTRAISAAKSSTTCSNSDRGTAVDEPHLKRLLGCKSLRRVQVLRGTLPVHEYPRLDHRFSSRKAVALKERHLEVGVVGGNRDIGE